MTWEHVPPKSCNNAGAIKTKDIFEIKDNKYHYESQNGIKYRTICGDCNNSILGACSDVAFKNLYEQCVFFLDSLSCLSEEQYIEIDIYNIVKSVFGKFLAMSKEFVNSEIDNEMRNFILHDIIPTSLHLYFRIYPYASIIQCRNCLSSNVTNPNDYTTKGLLSLLYYYPFAFILSTETENIHNIDFLEHLDVKNHKSTICLTPQSAYYPNNGSLLEHDWPINIENKIVFMSDDTNKLISRR